MQYSRMSDMTKSIQVAFSAEVKSQLTKALEKAVDEIRVQIPEMIARVSSLVDVQLIDNPTRGLEVTFVIRDIEEIKKAIKENS